MAPMVKTLQEEIDDRAKWEADERVRDLLCSLDDIAKNIKDGRKLHSCIDKARLMQAMEDECRREIIGKIFSGAGLGPRDHSMFRAAS